MRKNGIALWFVGIAALAATTLLMLRQQAGPATRRRDTGARVPYDAGL